MSRAKEKKLRRSRQQPPKVAYQSTGKNLTSQAGLMPVFHFLNGLGLFDLLGEFVSVERSSQAEYSPAEAVMFVWLGLIGGGLPT